MGSLVKAKRKPSKAARAAQEKRERHLAALFEPADGGSSQAKRPAEDTGAGRKKRRETPDRMAKLDRLFEDDAPDKGVEEGEEARVDDDTPANTVEVNGGDEEEEEDESQANIAFPLGTMKRLSLSGSGPSVSGAKKKKGGPSGNSQGSPTTPSTLTPTFPKGRHSARSRKNGDDGAYTDPFESQLDAIGRRRSNSNHDFLIGGIHHGDLQCRLSSTFSLLKLICQDESVLVDIRHDLTDIFHDVAEWPPPSSCEAGSDLSALWKIGLMLCVRISMAPEHVMLLHEECWGVLFRMLAQAVGVAPEPSEEQSHCKEVTKRKGGKAECDVSPFDVLVTSANRDLGGRRGARTFLESHRDELALFAQRVAAFGYAGKDAPPSGTDESSISLLLHGVACLVFNTDRAILGQELGVAKRRSFSKARRSGRDPASRIFTSLSPSPLVEWLARPAQLNIVVSTLDRVLESGLPEAFDHPLLAPKVVLRTLYLCQMITLYADVLPSFPLSFVQTIASLLPALVASDHPACADATMRCLWILLYLTSPTRTIPAEERSLYGEKLLSAVIDALAPLLIPLSRSDEEHDKSVVSLAILTNVCRFNQAPIRSVLAHRCKVGETGTSPTFSTHLVAAWSRLREASQTDDMVLAGYCAMLLGVLSLGGEDERLTVVKELLGANKSGKWSSDRPMSVICATMQEFVLFQSDAKVLTKEACFLIQSISSEVMKSNDLHATLPSDSLGEIPEQHTA